MRRDTITQPSPVPSDGDQPAPMPDDPQPYRETSHVLSCMQCDFQVQMDIAVPTRKASAQRDEGIVRVRLDPRTRHDHETSALAKSSLARLS